MIINRDDIEKITELKDKVIGFTSGAFDILTSAHVDYLQQARQQCDYLIVGVNSDESIRNYKNPNRPIIPEQQRLKIIASLKAVDCCFLFDELNNHKNIEVIKPSIYFKGGDYTKSKLTSAVLVEQYGGRVELISSQENTSSTQIINKILETQTIERKNTYQNKAVLIDRDGTINEEVEYLSEPSKFVLTPYAGEALKKFQDAGYKIVVITTQAGIGLGYFTKEDFYKVNQEMFRQLAPYNVTIDKIYFATHSKQADGKNPKRELVLRAKEELDLDLSQCIAIGDKTGDLAAATECKKFGVRTGHGLKDRQYQLTDVTMIDNLMGVWESFENLNKTI